MKKDFKKILKCRRYSPEVLKKAFFCWNNIVVIIFDPLYHFLQLELSWKVFTEELRRSQHSLERCAIVHRFGLALVFNDLLLNSVLRVCNWLTGCVHTRTALYETRKEPISFKKSYKLFKNYRKIDFYKISVNLINPSRWHAAQVYITVTFVAE